MMWMLLKFIDLIMFMLWRFIDFLIFMLLRFSDCVGLMNIARSFPEPSLLREKPMLLTKVTSAMLVRIAPITRNPGG
jgi:hypothetical protein